MLNSYLEIVILLFAISSVFLVFLSIIPENKFYRKVLGLLIITIVMLMADDRYVYLLGLFLLGTAVTSTKFLLGIIEKWKTDTKVEKHISGNININDKTLIKK